MVFYLLQAPSVEELSKQGQLEREGAKAFYRRQPHTTRRFGGSKNCYDDHREELHRVRGDEWVTKNDCYLIRFPTVVWFVTEKICSNHSTLLNTLKVNVNK